MRERYQLPSEVGEEKVYLPDYVTVSWKTKKGTYTVEVHPDRALDFIEQQGRIEEIEDWWFDY